MVAGLGRFLPEDRLKSTLGSIFRYNFLTDFRDFSNVQRTYALNDEKGLLLCSWPKGGRPPLPFVYSDEVWTGIEYQVASHLLYEGLLEEGLSIVKGVRDRYDGRRRNPWDEVECGHHYARAMSSWGLLLALSGFSYSGVDMTIGFEPKLYPEDFRTLWTTGSGWGSYSQNLTAENNLTVKLSAASGELRLKEFSFLPPPAFRDEGPRRSRGDAGQGEVYARAAPEPRPRGRQVGQTRRCQAGRGPDARGPVLKEDESRYSFYFSWPAKAFILMTGTMLLGMMPHWMFGASFWTNSHWMMVGFLVSAA